MSTLAEALVAKVGADITDYQRHMNRVKQIAATAGRAVEKAGVAGADAMTALGKSAKSAVSYLGAVGQAASTAYSVIGSAASIYLAPVRMLGSALATAASYAASLARKLASFAWTQFKRGMLAVTAAVLGGTKVWADFETQLANVSTMLSDPDAFMGQFKAGIRELAMEFGESTAALSGGLYDILSASIPAAKALDVLRVSTMAAKAGLTDTKTAADAITTILNAYGLEAEKASEVSDMLFATVARGKTTFAELASNIGLVATTAASAGVSMDEMGAMLATMTRAGVKTENAITALQAIIASFLKPTDEAVELAAELGFEMNSTALETMGLHGILQKISQLPADALARLFPNQRALRGILPALKNMEGFAKDLDVMASKAGMTSEAYEKMATTLATSYNQVKQSVLTLLGLIGEQFAPIISEAFEIVKEWLDLAIQWWNEHGDEVGTIAETLWYEVRTAAWNAWVYVDQNVLEPLRKKHGSVWEALKTGASTTWDAVKSAATTAWEFLQKEVLTPLRGEHDSIWSAMTAAASGAWTTVTKAWEEAKPMILKFWEWLKKLFSDDWKSAVEDAAKAVTLMLAKVLEVNNELWKAAVSWGTSVGGAIAEGVYQALPDWLKAAVTAGGYVLPGAIGPATQLGGALGNIAGQSNDAVSQASGTSGWDPTEAAGRLGGLAGLAGSKSVTHINNNYYYPIDKRQEERLSRSMQLMGKRGQTAPGF